MITGCNNSHNYKNVTSSVSDIDFYELVEIENYDETTKILLSIPSFLNKVSTSNKKTVFSYNFFENKTGYIVSLDKLESRNTQKLNDKEYIDNVNNSFQNDMNGDLSEIERILPPSVENVTVVQFEGNLLINDKYFLKRVSYYLNKNLEGTFLEGVNCTEFHFVTIHNKKKYSLNIRYFGDDKTISDLVGLFNTIGGSIKFK